MNIKMVSQSNSPQGQANWKSVIKGKVRMYTLFAFIIAVFMLPTSALGNTIYFLFDAESDPITDNWASTATDRWTDAQSLVSRSNAVAKNGSWSLRHEMNAQVNIQTGKVSKFFGQEPGNQPIEAFYSAWFYIESGFGDGFWKNIFQFKSRNNQNIGGGVKIVIGASVLDTGAGPRRQLDLVIDDCELPDGAFPKWQGEVSPGDDRCKIRQFDTGGIEIPNNQWFHIEMFLRIGDPLRLGNQDQLRSGIIKVWQDGQLIWDIDHPDLNTLSVFGRDSNHPNQWSDNHELYWGIGAYGSEASNPPLLILHTDDAMVTDYPVHVNSPADTTPPSAPVGLRIQ